MVHWFQETSRIEEITRVNYERELVKRELTPQPVRGFRRMVGHSVALNML